MLVAERHAIETLERGRDLPRDLVEAVIERMLSGQSSPADMRDFLVGLQRKGETVDELVGAAQAMRRAMVRIESDFPIVMDTCGTGGDGSQTFNISTAAAIVIAAAGVPVAKHGNRRVTSSTGSADVLAELGINLDAPPAVVERCLNELKLCFCFAQRFHPAMKHVAEVRRSLTGPTIFNRLGPLCNPAGANRQVLGVGGHELQLKLAAALERLGTDRSLVVRGEDGVDEVTLEGATVVLEVG
ncbi:MAG: anthranilate phosphoribosyltransferase, partial [Aureliella sp.]